MIEKKRLMIDNFGAIKKLNITIDRELNLIIGPQASGKSTIGKLLYFCNKIRDYYVDYILQESFFLQIHPNELYINFLKYIRLQFMGCFGTTKHMAPFSISFFYNSDSWVKIYLRNGYAIFDFSADVEKAIKDSLIEVQNIYKQKYVQDFAFNFSSKLNLKNEIKTHFSSVANEAFSMEEDVIYIPAGRSLLAVLSEQLDVVDISSIDLPMKEFIERIRRTKSRFGTRIDGVVADYLKTVQGQIKNADVDIARELIHSILKADYVNDTDGEKLYFDEIHWVKLIYGSSGQQEVLWILLLVFLIILENRKTFVVLEEPEAHLYPKAQMQIIELLAVAMNSAGCRFLVTTHSPYILSSTNLLIQSALVENRVKRQGMPIIRKQLRIAPHKISAYKILEGNEFVFKSIIDSEYGMIDSIAIDTVSEEINYFSELLDEVETKNDMS